ncbi:class D sortase [Neobacillus sp. WH10]|uniref:class D sortase n=1 Tax=Neobacillus sp. WH10 TaxID=3047873 RepID=UPI0024C2074C|nr:class D sortase [Neobacillus sp. WH10]WHY76387.1 class D sortase [Neobacillus sp. WH10]
MKSKLPLFIILIGIILLTIGLWQYVDMKYQTEASLKQAKEIISKQHTDTQKKKIENSPPPGMGDTVGLLTIPKINSELAIVEGTDPDDLEKGVGHYKSSYFPGEQGQIVLSGHRDTVFRKLGELKIGDSLKIQMPNGNFKYEITHTKVVKSDDTSIITLQNQQEELIVTTCYPFRYVGNAPKRYIIYAKPKSS